MPAACLLLAGRRWLLRACCLQDDEPGLEISLNMGDDGGDALDVLGGPKSVLTAMRNLIPMRA
eukprot:scaffold114417_cov18-Tisochrysis_lutea.AAC.1